jgi:hypothetical protein
MFDIRKFIEGHGFSEATDQAILLALDTSWKGDAKGGVECRGGCLALSVIPRRRRGEDGIFSIYRER